MADKVLVNNFQTAAADTVETVYTATNDTIISAFTASNSGNASSYYKAYIIDAGDSVGDPVQPLTIVVKDKKHNGSGVVNQLIPSGGTLRVEDSTAGNLNFYVTGRTDT